MPISFVRESLARQRAGNDRDYLQGGLDIHEADIAFQQRVRDMYLKLAKYKNAGVHEYWMVDPEKHQVLVWDEKEGDRLAVYDLESRIPVAITDGDLEIDFEEIMEELSYLQQ